MDISRYSYQEHVQFDRQINILLLGPCGVGKSTLVQTILQPQDGTRRGSKKDIRMAYPTQIKIKVIEPETNNKYLLNIIDTPGLFNSPDIVPGDTINQINNELLKLDYIDIICIMARAEFIHLDDSKEIVMLFNRMKSEYSNISMLILTECEKLNQQKLEQIEEEIKHDNRNIWSHCKLGVSYIGAIDLEFIDSYPNVDNQMNVKAKLTNVVIKMKMDLITKFINTSKYKRIKICRSFLRPWTLRERFSFWFQKYRKVMIPVCVVIASAFVVTFCIIGYIIYSGNSNNNNPTLNNNNSPPNLTYIQN